MVHHPGDPDLTHQALVALPPMVHQGDPIHPTLALASLLVHSLRRNLNCCKRKCADMVNVEDTQVEAQSAQEDPEVVEDLAVQGLGAQEDLAVQGLEAQEDLAVQGLEAQEDLAVQGLEDLGAREGFQEVPDFPGAQEGYQEAKAEGPLQVLGDFQEVPKDPQEVLGDFQEVPKDFQGVQEGLQGVQEGPQGVQKDLQGVQEDLREVPGEYLEAQKEIAIEIEEANLEAGGEVVVEVLQKMTAKRMMLNLKKRGRS